MLNDTLIFKCVLDARVNGFDGLRVVNKMIIFSLIWKEFVQKLPVRLAHLRQDTLQIHLEYPVSLCLRSQR